MRFGMWAHAGHAGEANPAGRDCRAGRLEYRAKPVGGTRIAALRAVGSDMQNRTPFTAGPTLG